MQRALTNLEIRVSSKTFPFIIQMEEVVATNCTSSSRATPMKKGDNNDERERE
jgi:hypothetical protein